jgi:hypothetical protein
VSRYDWPDGGKSPDRVADRLAWIATRRPHDPVVIDEAVAARRAAELASARKKRRTPKDPPVGNANLWVPIGPAAVLRGQAENSPRVSGRVRALAVHTAGLRAYAGTANGGLWYTDDGGASWLPIGVFVTARGGQTAGGTGAAGAQGLTVGALHVRFGNNADGSQDDVFVGTGELSARTQAFGYYGGVGVLRATGPVPAVRVNPSANPWTREAKNLVGRGVYRLARNPDQPDHVVAATGRGLFRRTLPVAADSDWDRITAAPFAAADTADNPCRVTDVVWVKPPGAPGTRLYIVLDDLRTGAGGGQSGLWFADVDAAGAIGAFQSVALAGLTPSGATGSRLGLAAAAAPSPLVYVLGLSGAMAAANPRLWRVDGSTAPPTVNVVGRVPPGLFGGPGPGQHDYDLTLAVDPANANRVVLGGSTLFRAVDWSAALFVCTVAAGGPTGFRLDYTQPAGSETNDATWRGPGVHADVHAAAFARSAQPEAQRAIWVGCDGGVYASNRNGRRDSFVARNTGIASLEVGFVAASPASDVDMLGGTQDNGTLQRIGESVWQVRFVGDGGGNAYDPQRPDRYVRQNTNADWNDQAGTLMPFVFRVGTPQAPQPDENFETSRADFYSDADSVVSNGRTLLAVGTYRVWLSTNWGAAGSWVTLPSGQDPKAANPVDTRTDACVRLATGGVSLPDSAVVTVRWASPTRLLVLCQRAVIAHHVTDNPAAATPVTSQAHRVEQITDGGKIKNRGSAGVAQHHLPTSCAWTDIFSHDPAREDHGSLYVTTAGPEDPAAANAPDTLWWFDGEDTWFATGLRTSPQGTKAPAYAVVVDPDDKSIVYVGTGAGVWRGAFDVDDKEWTWQVFSNGLPEATVADLEIIKLGTVKLLRAAVHALGVYEVDLTGPTAPRTFLRVHDLDSRRVSPTPLSDPRVNPAAAIRWEASPDLRPRMDLGAPAPAPPASALQNITGNPANPADAHRLWVFQTALRRIDPLVRPDGRWTPDFQARLVARRQAAGLGGAARVDAPLWNNVVTAARRYAKPWDDPPAGVTDPGPSEADLIELIVDRPAPAGDAASLALTRGVAKVEVLVHHRHALAAEGATVRVVLLRHALGASPDDGAALPVTWTAKVAEALASGNPPTGGWGSLADGWAVADGTTPLRSPAYSVHPRTARAVTFDVDFSAGPPNSRWILVAIASSTVDTAGFTGANLRDLVLRSRCAAARTVRLV